MDIQEYLIKLNEDEKKKEAKRKGNKNKNKNKKKSSKTKISYSDSYYDFALIFLPDFGKAYRKLIRDNCKRDKIFKKATSLPINKLLDQNLSERTALKLLANAINSELCKRIYEKTFLNKFKYEYGIESIIMPTGEMKFTFGSGDYRDNYFICADIHRTLSMPLKTSLKKDLELDKRLEAEYIAACKHSVDFRSFGFLNSDMISIVSHDSMKLGLLLRKFLKVNRISETTIIKNAVAAVQKFLEE